MRMTCLYVALGGPPGIHTFTQGSLNNHFYPKLLVILTYQIPSGPDIKLFEITIPLNEFVLARNKIICLSSVDDDFNGF